MRANALLTSVLYSCAFVVGHVRADDQAVFEEAATESFTSVAESSTSSIIEKPTFTVRISSRIVRQQSTSSETVADTFGSLSVSKHPSLSSLRMTGALDGRRHMRRRKIRRRTRSGSMSANGL